MIGGEKGKKNNPRDKYRLENAKISYCSDVYSLDMPFASDITGVVEHLPWRCTLLAWTCQSTMIT